jgi:CheY-like chemotaxis protein
MAKKILVVDDDPITLRLVESELVSYNYKVVTASDGKEGLEKARNQMPDLIVLDIIMPKMDGYTFVREIKADSSLKHIPIIILTAKDKMKDLFEIEGIEDYLVKPFNPQDLLNRIETYFKK